MMYLVDKSAWEQRYRSQEAEDRLTELTGRGAVATCQVVMLELLYSARNAAHYRHLAAWLECLRHLPTGDAGLDRALEIQSQLVDQGQHRRPLPDLIIAATAEHHGATLLHYDRDFDLIAQVTGQSTEWIIARGTH